MSIKKRPRLDRLLALLFLLASACAPAPAGSKWDGGPTPDGPLAATAERAAARMAERDPFVKELITPDVCKPRSAHNPNGRKAVMVKRDAAGDWALMLEPHARYQSLLIDRPRKKEALSTVDYLREQVAGFVLSRQTTAINGEASLAAPIIEAVSKLIRAKGGRLRIRASGSAGRSHDAFDRLSGMVFDITFARAVSASALRDAIVASLLGRKIEKISNLAAPIGLRTSAIVLRLAAIRRFAFKRNSDGSLIKDRYGDPVDSGDRQSWRAVIVGALADAAAYKRHDAQTGIRADDLSDGSNVARASASFVDECVVAPLPRRPKLDLIWVAPEREKVKGDKQRLAAHAGLLVARALDYGLDLRIGVTGMVSPTGSSKHLLGKLCSRASSDPNDNGGEDRFLSPAELSTIIACLQNPPGNEPDSRFGLSNAREAIAQHIPRHGLLRGIRANARIAVVISTDGPAQEIASLVEEPISRSCWRTNQAIARALRPFADYFMGRIDRTVFASFHVLGGACHNACGHDRADGYLEILQDFGIAPVDSCRVGTYGWPETLLGATMFSSWRYGPRGFAASTSVAVAVDGVPIARSRTKGFDFRPHSNSVALIGFDIYDKSLAISSKTWR